MSYLQTTNWDSAALIWLQVNWRSQHCHAPRKTWVFYFTALHLIRQEGKKALVPEAAGEKGLCVAGTGRCCGELQPEAQLVCSQILLSKSYPKIRRAPGCESFPLFAYCNVMSGGVCVLQKHPGYRHEPMSSQMSAETPRGCNLLSVCKQECCCFVCLFRVLGEGEVEDKVTSVLNPWLFTEVKIPAEHISLLCGENSLIIQTDSLYQHMSAVSAGAASGVWGWRETGSWAVYRGINNKKGKEEKKADSQCKCSFLSS